jgi:hypothetical protein
VHQYQLGSSSRPRVATSSAGPVFRHAQLQFQLKPHAAGQGFSTPQRQVIRRPNNFQTPAARNQSAQRTQAAQNPLQGEWKCYACGERCHYANQCHNPRSRPPLIAVSTPPPTHGANYVPVAAKQNIARGRVNHVAVEEAQEARMLSLVYFSSTTLLQLCYLILEHRILSYLLRVLRSIICL